MNYSTAVNFKINLADGAVEFFTIPLSERSSYGIPEGLVTKLEEFGLTIDDVYMKDRKGKLFSLREVDAFVGGDNVLELFTDSSKNGFFVRRRQNKKEGFLKRMANRNDQLNAEIAAYEGSDPPQGSGVKGLAKQATRNIVGAVVGGSGHLPGGANRFSRPGFGGLGRHGGLGAYGGMGGFGGFAKFGTGSRVRTGLPGGCRRFGRPGFG